MSLDEERYKDLTARLDAVQRAQAFIIKQINRLTNEAERRKWKL